MDWFYAEGQQQNGPCTDEQFRALIDQGTVQPDTLVWHDGMEQWTPLAQVGDVPPPPETAPAPSGGLSVRRSPRQESAEPQPSEPQPEEPQSTSASSLSVRRRQEPDAPVAAESPAAGFAGGADMGNCSECNRQFPVGDMVQYGDATVCADCKDTFFQKIREGATPNFGGNTPNAQLMERARGNLSGRWGLAVGLFIVYIVILSVAGQIPFLTLILGGAFELGIAIFYLTIARGGEPELGMLFRGFQNFGVALGAYVVRSLIITAWMLLFIIPMVIAAGMEKPELMVLGLPLMIPAFIAQLAYSQTFYLLADDPTVGPLGAIRLSKRMMRGKKGKYFCLHLRFVGWAFLCILTLGIGMLWLVPYISASGAEFYDDLRYGRDT